MLLKLFNGVDSVKFIYLLLSSTLAQVAQNFLGLMYLHKCHLQKIQTRSEMDEVIFATWNC